MSKTGPKPAPPDERFWARVKRGTIDECWEWTGSRLSAGYGQFGLTRSRPVLSHRYSWFLFAGPIPDGLHVLHRCDNPPCCNPGHLFLGTNADNIADRVAKKRSAVGDAHWSRRMPDRVARGSQSNLAKLTEESVREILTMRGSITAQQVGQRYGISRSAVELIWKGLRWRHVQR